MLRCPYCVQHPREGRDTRRWNSCKIGVPFVAEGGGKIDIIIRSQSSGTHTSPQQFVQLKEYRALGRNMVSAEVAHATGTIVLRAEGS
jgi:hypothetical protein